MSGVYACRGPSVGDLVIGALRNKAGEMEMAAWPVPTVALCIGSHTVLLARNDALTLAEQLEGACRDS